MLIRDVSSKIIEIMQQLKNDQDTDPSVANGHALGNLGIALKCHQDDLAQRKVKHDAAEAEAAAEKEAEKKVADERKANLEARIHSLRKMRKEEPKHFTISHKQELETAKANLAAMLGKDAPADLLKHEDFDAHEAEQKKRDEEAAKKKKADPAPVKK